ncbi:MAG: cell division protein ZapB [Zhongshania sp.]|jgi:cell division protein ZapB
MDERQLQQVERKVDELVQLCEQLDKENRALKADARHWRTEREQLIEKTDIARAKIESMIQRLRALEKES